MKRLVYLTLLVIFAFSLSACAKATSQPTDETIKPGDKIGDFLITTGDEGEVTYTWDLGCVKKGEGETYFCEVAIGTKVNVSFGIYDDTLSGKLEDLWASHTYELFIENRHVNLQAFGFIDVIHPRVGKMRHWNVIIFTDKPGEITCYHSGVADGDPFESTMAYIFSAP